MFVVWAPVVTVAVLSQTRLGLESPWSGSDVQLALVSVAIAGPLLVRVRRPLLASALLALALIGQVALGGSLHFASFLAVLFAAYAAGRHARARQALLAAVLLLAGIVIAMRDAITDAPEELFIPAFYVSAAAALGFVVRRQVGQAAELRRLTETLLREREVRDRLAVATERLRLARELHDVVAHTLTVAVVQAEACEEALESDPARAREAVRQVQDAGRRGLADLRAMVRVLRDVEQASTTDDLGLAGLEGLRIALAGAGLDVELSTRGSLADLPPTLAGDVYRIIQESLTNVVKHSAARTARVQLTRLGDDLDVDVTDPGPLALLTLPGGGHGIAGMIERAAAYGGQVTAGPAGDGFRVHARLPLGSAARTSEVRA